MKNVFTILFFFMAVRALYACSCGPPTPFCPSAKNSQIGVFEVLSMDSTNFTMKVAWIQTLLGNFPNDTFDIIGQDGLNCNVSLSVFSIGDTAVLSLYPRAGTPFMDLITCYASYLKYQNGMVYGWIEPNVSSKKFSTFVDDLDDCLNGVSTDPIEAAEMVKIFPNPASNFLKIETKGLFIQRLEVFNRVSQIIWKEEVPIREESLELNVTSWEQGLYVIRVYTENGVFQRFILKQ